MQNEHSSMIDLLLLEYCVPAVLCPCLLLFFKIYFSSSFLPSSVVCSFVCLVGSLVFSRVGLYFIK
jgi:hypothetical protein